MRSDSETERAIQQTSSTVDVTIVAHDIGAVGGMERQLAELVTWGCAGSATRSR